MTSRAVPPVPVEKEAPARPRHVAAALAGVAAVVLAANAAAGWYLPRYTANLGYWLARNKWNMLLSMEKPAEWVVTGDSSGNQGLSPKIFERETGARAVNLCSVAGLTALNDVWMLEKYRERFGLPRGVLVVRTCLNWGHELDMRLASQIPLGADELRRLAPEAAFEPGAGYYASRFAWLYAHNKSLARILRSPGRWFRPPFALGPDGFMAAGVPDPVEVRRDFGNAVKAVAGRPFALSSSNRRGLECLARWAESSRVPVYLVNGPLYDGLARHEAFGPYFEKLEIVLNKFENPYFRYLDGIPGAFPESAMQNADHAIESAARAYTREVAIRLRAAPVP